MNDFLESGGYILLCLVISELLVIIVFLGIYFGIMIILGLPTKLDHVFGLLVLAQPIAVLMTINDYDL